MFWILELGIRIKTSVCSLIYRKSLKLTTSKLSEIGIGRIVTIVSKDVLSIEYAIIFLNDMWIGLILFVLTSALMYSRVGIAALAGSLFLLFIIPLQVLLGKLTSTLRLKGSKMTDRRLQVTQETISAIKIIKMYTWEIFFGKKISEARKAEMKKTRQIYWTKATALVTGGLVINLTLYIIVMTYIQLGNTFTAEVSFFILGCLQALRSTVTISIPIGIAQTAELIASVRRIYKVLAAKEQPETARDDKAPKASIQLQQVSVEINNTQILHDIDLNINSGLNFLTGRLGGGKSSLLKTILEDYPICDGKLHVKGTMSYAAEEPWLFPSSIRQNILFGQEFNEERYRKVLKVCALDFDIDTFEKGDHTIVDDRGQNLSKGQQARIGLARAVYCDSDIYLLDDCLSSLDTQVQKFVFTECVKNFLRDKIVVMISHNENQLKEADNIILMENGTVKSVLKPSDIPDEELENFVREKDKVDEDDIIDNIVVDEEDDQEDAKLIKSKPNQNIYHENKKEGSVAYKVYQKYSAFGGGYLVLVPLFIVFVAAQFMTSYSQQLVSSWVNIQQNISEYKSNTTNTTQYDKLVKKNSKALTVYSVAVIASTLLLLFRAYAYFTFAGKASVGLHKSMILSVVKATMKFFDLHYIGNILNRFSKDLATIDEILPLNFYECLSFVCRVTGMLILILIVQWTFILPAIVVFVILFFLRRWYLPTGRSLKRLDSATRSPMIGHINASLEGLTTIRAYGTQQILKKEFDRHQDLYTSTFYMMQSTSRAFAYFLDMLCNFFIIAIVLRFVVVRKDTLAGNVGLAITQALGLTGLLQWGIRQWAELENQMTSVERVVEYINVEQENRSGQSIDNWPQKCKITYKDVNLTYGKSKDYVLKNINFTINSREKVGIVGRTGAGKSSLISVLFRLYQYDGTISIDDVDIRTLSLEFLRSNISIIPQDPILFSGTIRDNIDPTGRYKDHEIWKAISTTRLKDIVPSLDYRITEGGSNFSAGQRQLICLARAVISKSKIIVLDEATANVDPETDVMIYTTIQECFAECTVLMIAHRLHTVLYSDKVMVVDKGEIVEFDNPNVLLDNKNGAFYKMIEQANLLK
ncbi:probable multidrug resistance-associated protein lethal(2)03659 isoform X2 [Zophobas morio]